MALPLIFPGSAQRDGSRSMRALTLRHSQPTRSAVPFDPDTFPVSALMQKPRHKLRKELKAAA